MWFFDSAPASGAKPANETKKQSRAPRLPHCPVRDNATQAAIELAVVQKLLETAQR